jgi:hypothetical protein
MAFALVGVFLLLAGLHLYWGVGGFWPGSDAESLRERVVGTRSGPMFGFAACAAVAAALLAAAAVVLTRHTAPPLQSPVWLAAAGYGALILVFLARGAAPYLTPVFEYSRGTPFFDLNRFYYAPLCLVIAALLALDFPRAAWGHGTPP